METLPADRISTKLPFTYFGFDMFRSFMVKQYKKELKQYGIIFTCLLFIQVLRKIIARRENIRLIRSYNGTNFVGTKSELQKALSQMDEEKMAHFLCGMVELIGLRRKAILQEATCEEFGSSRLISTWDTISIAKVCASLDNKLLITLMIEIDESIVNCKLETLK